MRKGAKRKVLPPATEEVAVPTRVKRVRDSRPPEYVEEQRNLQDLWKAPFPVGTELDRLVSVYQYDWDFSNLEKQFEEEGGKFHGIGSNNNVYLFCQTETRNNHDCKVLIPTLVAVVAPRPPTTEVAVRSVQKEQEEKVIVPMRQMKMDWIPYIPLDQREGRNRAASNLPQIFVLGCTLRKASMKKMKEERWFQFQYCMPYMMNTKEEEEEEPNTVVDILFPREPQAPLVAQFDWEMDKVGEYTDELMEAEELREDQKEAFMEFLREEVRRAKRTLREEREAKRRLREEDPKYQEAKAYNGNMRLYKIYPVQTPDTPVIEMKTSYFSYFYGHVHEII